LGRRLELRRLRWLWGLGILRVALARLRLRRLGVGAARRHSVRRLLLRRLRILRLGRWLLVLLVLLLLVLLLVLLRRAWRGPHLLRHLLRGHLLRERRHLRWRGRGRRLLAWVAWMSERRRRHGRRVPRCAAG
jgi:hypothetical protein